MQDKYIMKMCSCYIPVYSSWKTFFNLYKQKQYTNCFIYIVLKYNSQKQQLKLVSLRFKYICLLLLHPPGKHLDLLFFLRQSCGSGSRQNGYEYRSGFDPPEKAEQDPAGFATLVALLYGYAYLIQGKNKSNRIIFNDIQKSFQLGEKTKLLAEKISQGHPLQKVGKSQEFSCMGSPEVYT